MRKKAKASLHPAQVESTLLHLAEQWPPSASPLLEVIEQFPLGEAALLHLMAMSGICAARLVRGPEILFWLQRRDVCLTPRSYGQMSNELHAMAGDAVAADNFRALRLWKSREMVRVAQRELADVAALEETTSELSQIAEICIRRVFEHWNNDFRQRFGSPSAEFAILALGKLGGGELNHSSDIDLIFLYSEEGELSPRLSYHEFFNRLGKKIIETFSTRDPQGSLFRIDLRLRPEGSAGPLARSLASMEHYYSGFGETWERLALIKARGIAGSRELAYEFLRQHQPFIYPKSPTPDLLDEIADIKRRIERDVVGAAKLERDVKLGRGGIREIEFVVQTLQFIHGARHAFLQETSTLKALQDLAELELIPRPEILDLDRAYRFLRRTEHRLQIENEEQTHTIPTDPDQVRRLALSLGLGSPEDFRAALKDQMDSVRAVFRRVIGDAPRDKDKEGINLGFFVNQPAAERALAHLARGSSSAHVAPRTRQVFYKLQPLLLGWLKKMADPDGTLTQFVRFVQGYGMRGGLFELLVTNPKLLELLVKIFDASRFAGDLLVRHPQLLEDATRAGTLDLGRDTSQHLERLRQLDKKEKNLDRVRTYRQAQLLRIMLRDVLGLAGASTLCGEQSALAEACLVFVNEIAGSDELTIVAMGKFGGREITYGADLDVLFVANESSTAQKLLSTLSHPSAEGNLSRIDTRLRPEGETGPLVCSLETYQTYYSSRAQLWELQALSRARPIVGPRQDEFTALAKHAWQEGGQRTDLYARIDDMRERIRRERGSGSEFLDFKTGTGGIIEAEFLVQGLQMRKNVWEPNWSQAVDRLGQSGQFSGAEAMSIKAAYDFLRRCESVLRRYENTSVSALPGEPREFGMFCHRMGFTVETFKQKYEAMRGTVREIYLRHMGEASTTSGPAISGSLAEQRS